MFHKSMDLLISSTLYLSYRKLIASILARVESLVCTSHSNRDQRKIM